MPLLKFLPKPGINKENTRYTTEGGWWDGDKVRFRQGTPEAIGGWQRISATTYLGTCRSLWSWNSLGGSRLIGVGTNLKFYISRGGAYFDITPLRSTVTLTDPFTATNGSDTILVTDAAHGANAGDFVTFSGASGLGGNITAAVLNQEFQIQTVPSANTFTIQVSATANATDAAAPGGGTVTTKYQLNTGNDFSVPMVGWGASFYGTGTWGFGQTGTVPMRLWSQSNYGEDLVFAPRGGGLYYWDTSVGVYTRGVAVTSMGGASDVPTVVNKVLVSDTSRFVLAFGCNDIGSSSIDPMLVRWSDQESVVNWTPAITNQAGGIRLSQGSQIVAAIQVRQEIAVWTDTAMYSMQYVGPPYVWSTQLLGDNISIISPNAAVMASGVAFWMGFDKFYAYDGRLQTLSSDLRKFVYNDINLDQSMQVFAGTNEGFNEVWWFYCSANSTTIDRYVVYNYVERIWYYGTMARTAWLDSAYNGNPLAATYLHNLVEHEVGVDDNATGTLQAINSYISSSEFDIGDGHNFGFIWRALPDLTFSGSTSGTSPEVSMTIYPMLNSGSGTAPAVSANVVKGNTYVITEEFTGQVGMRVRGRQMIMKVGSNKIGTTWQLGATRLDVRPDGRR